jgi:2-oxoisovalerate dehydrogenase E1 component
MPKCQPILPSEVRKSDTISILDIPVNQYSDSLEKARSRHGDATLKQILHDMQLIREFESMLDQVKKEGHYQSLEYNHKGPAHLSIGQEAAAVGMAFTLSPEDHIFGSHRSHGEILAKGMSAIRHLDDDSLLHIMKSFMDGQILKIVEKGHDGSIKDLAIDFLVYGSLAEVFGRGTGFNQGLGGSMHAFFTPFGIYPNNALVGGSADIAAGAALYKRVNRKDGIVIANIGDASMGCGPVFEALNFSSMDQYTTLWDEAHQGGLPIIFNFFNNFYGMGGQTAGETMGYGLVARIGAGLNPDAMHAERVDGYNPLAVIDAVERKRQIIEERRGPVLLETMTYRVSGHSPSDASSYRSKEEIDAWREADAIQAYADELCSGGVLNQQAVDEQDGQLKKRIFAAYQKAIDLDISPRITAERVGELMFSNRSVVSYAPEREADMSCSRDENPRCKQLGRKIRSATKDGKPVPKTKLFQLRDGIFEAMLAAYERDASMCAWGEENRDWGGAFACYRGLTEAVPYHRLFNSPISEAAIVGAGVGYALEGGRCVAELMYCDFMGRAGDEIFNQMAKWQSMSAGVLDMPLVLRVSVGAKYGAQHSQDWTAIVNHIPGLKIAFPATPYDAKGLLNAALMGSDPVIFFESQRLYDIGEEFETEVPEGDYTVEFGVPAKRRDGADITILTIGATLYRALEAADELAQKYGLQAEVWDARTINPFDYQPIVDSIKKTGRIVLAGDACERGSVMQSMAANLSRYAFDYLDAPPAVVGSRNWITPCAEMEDAFFPQASWIIDAIHEQLLPLDGHIPMSNQCNAESLRRNKQGI